MVSIGLDIGTSNTVVAAVDPNGKAYAHRFGQSALVPSMVFIEPPAGNRSYGGAAQAYITLGDEGWGYRRWKVAMGDDVELARLSLAQREVVVTPEQLTTWLVEHVVSEFSKGVGGAKVDDVVVTVPHGWRRGSTHKVDATRAAAAAARVDGKPLRVRERTVDEPVAAAAYWLHEVPEREQLVGRTVLVVDIGGGTFDLSLVRVGAADHPLVVVDAQHNEVAGDYVTALVLADAFRSAPADAGVGDLTSAPAILAAVAGGDQPWLMAAFRATEAAMHDTSAAMAVAEARNRNWGTAPAPFVVVGPQDQVIQANLTARHFAETAASFYESGQQLLRGFLQMQQASDRPAAVVFAGGGSRIGGVRSQLVRPVLNEVLGEQRATEAMRRIQMNIETADVAIALGAALIANDLETIEERLLFDVGLRVEATYPMAKELGLGEGTANKVPIIMSPLLAKGAALPVRYSSREGGVPLRLPPGVPVQVTLVSFDDPERPHLQQWSSDEPNGPKLVTADVEVWATAEGALGVTVRTRNSEMSFEGRLERAQRQFVAQTFEIGPELAVPVQEALPPVRTPQEVERAYTTAMSGKGN